MVSRYHPLKPTTTEQARHISSLLARERLDRLDAHQPVMERADLLVAQRDKNMQAARQKFSMYHVATLLLQR